MDNLLSITFTAHSTACFVHEQNEWKIPIYQWQKIIPLVRMDNVVLPVINYHINGTNQKYFTPMNTSLTNGQNDLLIRGTTKITKPTIGMFATVLYNPQELVMII